MGSVVGWSIAPGGFLVRTGRCGSVCTRRASRESHVTVRAVLDPEKTEVERWRTPGPASEFVGKDDDRVALPVAESAEANADALVPTLMLNAVTVLWGTQHCVIKHAVDAGGVSPDVLNLSRFALAACLLTPFLNASGRSESVNPEADDAESTTSALLAGVELGMWMFAGYALQSLGLLTTTAGKSAFLLYLNVKLVPIFAATFYGRVIDVGTWASAAAAALGTALLCFDGGGLPRTGDLLSIAAAACSAMYILRLESAARRHRATDLTVSSLWSTVLLCGVWVVATHRPESVADILPSWESLPEVVYLGAVTTAFTTVLQTIGQRVVAAEKAAVIYALDPVYAAGFAYLFIGEQLGTAGLVGAGLVSVAAIGSQEAVLRPLRAFTARIWSRR